MKVVVGLLGSPEGEAAIAAATAEAMLRDGELCLVVHVADSVDAQTSRSYTRNRELALARGEEVAQGLRAEGLAVAVHAPTGAASPSEAILQVAREETADLVVIGMRRRSRVGKLVMGSNAQDILLSADVPVLAVKPRTEDR